MRFARFSRRAGVMILGLVAAVLGGHAEEGAPKGGKQELTLEGIRIGEDELPEGFSLSRELHCVSTQPAVLYEMPDQEGLLPAVKGKLAQSVHKDGEKPGTLIAIEYEEPVPQDLAGYLASLLWGTDGGPTQRHPEEMCVSGRFLLVLSFEQGSAAAAWLKKRFRARFDLRVASISAEHRAVLMKVGGPYFAGELDKALAALTANEAKVRDCALAHFLGGEICLAAEKWGQVEKFMRRAIELDGGASPLPGDRELWGAHDALGVALLMQKKYDQAADQLARSRDLARTLADPVLVASAEYNLACACARAGRYDAALAALKACIELDPKYRNQAKSDPDLEVVIDRDEFKALVE